MKEQKTYREWLVETYPTLVPSFDEISAAFSRHFVEQMLADLSRPIPYTVTEAGKAMLKDGPE